MNAISLSTLGLILCLLTSCGTQTLPLAQLSGPEQDLLQAINQHRATSGQKALMPSANLTEIARADAGRRAGTGGGYVDHRQDTGYERMLTLAGKARTGPQFGNDLMKTWQRNPLQRSWLQGNYAGVGVGTAIGANGLQTGVLLLGGFSGPGI